jgi:hypothetical protein
MSTVNLIMMITGYWFWAGVIVVLGWAGFGWLRQQQQRRPL